MDKGISVKGESSALTKSRIANLKSTLRDPNRDQLK